MSLRDIPLQRTYEGPGSELLSRFVLPCLREAERYDRVTSWFTVKSLVAIGAGIEQLWRRGGGMRLVIGIHDVPAPLALAASEGSQLSEEIERLRSLLLADVTALQDELARNTIATIAWMLQDGLLQVRIAAVRGADSQHAVFHPKRFIFVDAAGHVVSAEGSPNETGMGLGGNIEGLTVLMSWDNEPYTSDHQRAFEELWEGRRAYVRIRELDASFAEELLATLGNPPRPRDASRVESPPKHAIDQVLRFLRTTPDLAPMNLGVSALFPHQERALIETTSRWPMRALLADEVGLGKTIEAASAMAFAIRHLGVKRVLVLAPAGLVRQWQEEMRDHFGLDFWVFDPSRRLHVSAEGVERRFGEGSHPLEAGSPHLVITSYHWARGDKAVGPRLTPGGPLPDLLVLDEAHAARVRRYEDGSQERTLLARLIESLAPVIPHLLLLTATPMQLRVEEMFDLLSYLGLPDGWDEAAYLFSLETLGSGPDVAPVLQTAGRAGRLIASTISEMRPPLAGEAAGLAGDLVDLSSMGVAQAASEVQRRWAEVYGLFASTHPAHLLTVRHTRGVLERIPGYRFPARELRAPVISVSESVTRLYGTIDQYLTQMLGRVEQALHPGRRFNPGFMRSSYRQRFASSLFAARRSLRARRRRIEELLDRGSAANQARDDQGDLDADDWEELFGDLVPDANANWAAIEYECQSELHALDDLLAGFEGLRDLGDDPKLAVAVELVADHLAAGDSLLIFSRYTDTLAAFEQLFRRHFESEIPPHAKYTGSESWLETRGRRREVRKDELTAEVREGTVRVVICSDAASEGLNLQGARVIVNLDVPWNPARLEQRIGRVARLGQRASTVVIYNLWFPDSVEKRMYERLLQRHDDYQLAVGEFPEIVAEAIRDEVAADMTGGYRRVDEAIEQLQELRADNQVTALRSLMVANELRLTRSQEMRARILEGIAIAASRAGWSVRSDNGVVELVAEGGRWLLTEEAGVPESFTFNHPVFDRLAEVLPPPRGDWHVQCLTPSGDLTPSLEVAAGHETYFVSSDGAVALLEDLLRDRRPDFARREFRPTSAGSSEHGVPQDGATPRPGRLRTCVSLTSGPPPQLG